MNKKKISVFLAAICIASSGFMARAQDVPVEEDTQPVAVTEEDNSYPTPYEMNEFFVSYCQQEKTKWCWIACAQMCGTNADFSVTPKYSQTQIALYAMGSTENRVNTNEEIERALEFTTGSKDIVLSYGAFDFDFVKNWLEEKPINGTSMVGAGTPMIANLLSTNGGSGHDVVISGYDDLTVMNPGNNGKLGIMDPWIGASDSIQFYPTNDMISGTTIESGKFRWYGTIYYR